MTSVGDGGWCWSSSTYASGNINAGNLNFNASNVNPLNNNNRSYGFAVRCVQHLRPFFFDFLGRTEQEGPALRPGVVQATVCTSEVGQIQRSVDGSRTMTAGFSSQSGPEPAEGLSGTFNPAIAA